MGWKSTQERRALCNASSRETEIATSPVSHLSNEPVLSRVFCTDGEREDGRGETKRIWLERG